MSYILCPICFTELPIERRTQRNVPRDKEKITDPVLKSPETHLVIKQKDKVGFPVEPSDDEIADRMGGLLLQGWVMMAASCEG